MSFFRRNQLFLLGFILVIILLLVWFWRFLPFALMQQIWNQPDIKAIILGLIPTALVGAFAIFRTSIVAAVKKLIAPGGTETDRQRWQQEKLYLQNFIRTYQDNLEPNSPWEVTKYTDLEALQKDQDKRARVIRPRLRALPGGSDIHAEESLGARVNIQSFLRREKGPIMVKGEPGTGKTLTIRRFAYDQAKEALNSAPGTVKLPLYIPLSRYTGRTADGKEPEPVIDFMRRYIQSIPTASIIAEDLEKVYLLPGRLLLLFDGLNELLPDEYRDRSRK